MTAYHASFSQTGDHRLQNRHLTTEQRWLVEINQIRISRRRAVRYFINHDPFAVDLYQPPHAVIHVRRYHVVVRIRDHADQLSIIFGC